MHFSDDTKESAENGKLRPAVISLILVLMIAPLTWSLWDAWRENFVQRSVSRLVQYYKNQLEVVSWQWDGAKVKLMLYNFQKATPAVRSEIEKALQRISPRAKLELHESTVSRDMEELANQLKASQFTALVNNPKIIEGLVKLANTENADEELMSVVQKHEDDLAVLVGEQNSVRGYVRARGDSLDVMYLISTQSRTERLRIQREQMRFHDWIKSKLPEGVTVRFEVF